MPGAPRFAVFETWDSTELSLLRFVFLWCFAPPAVTQGTQTPEASPQCAETVWGFGPGPTFANPANVGHPKISDQYSPTELYFRRNAGHPLHETPTKAVPWAVEFFRNSGGDERGTAERSKIGERRAALVR